MDRTRALAGLLDRATGEGAQAAEILTSDTTWFHATASRGRVQRAVSGDESSASIRVWVEGRQGHARGKASDLPALLDRALTRARGAAGEADAWAGPVGRTAAEGATADIDDRRYAHITKEDRLDVLVSAEKATRAVDRSLELTEFGYRDARSIRHFVNTRGLRLREAGTRFRIEGAVRSPTLRLTLADVVEDRAFATVASLPFGASLARRLVELGGETVQVQGPHRVMLPPRVVAELFALLGPHFVGAELEKNGTFLSKARSGGDLTLSPMLHLVDDGRLPGALNSRSFDDRGVSPVPITLIRDGVVDGWYLDVAEARRIDARPTGHDHEGALQPGNLVVRGGSRSMNALLAEQPEPVVVLDHVRDLFEGLDLKTGAIDCEASGRLVVPRNTTQGWMPRFRLVGDLTRVLASIVDLASDTDRHGHVDAPGMMVDGFHVEPV